MLDSITIILLNQLFCIKIISTLDVIIDQKSSKKFFEIYLLLLRKDNFKEQT